MNGDGLLKGRDARLLARLPKAVAAGLAMRAIGRSRDARNPVADTVFGQGFVCPADTSRFCARAVAIKDGTPTASRSTRTARGSAVARRSLIAAWPGRAEQGSRN